LYSENLVSFIPQPVFMEHTSHVRHCTSAEDPAVNKPRAFKELPLQRVWERSNDFPIMDG
jgi:hypothetical protein